MNKKDLVISFNENALKEKIGILCSSADCEYFVAEEGDCDDCPLDTFEPKKFVLWLTS